MSSDSRGMRMRRIGSSDSVCRLSAAGQPALASYGIGRQDRGNGPGGFGAGGLYRPVARDPDFRFRARNEIPDLCREADLSRYND